MSFQNKSFWTPRDAGCLTGGDIGYDTHSKLEPKRTHQWFTDASEQELFGNKKQAIEDVNSRPMPRFSNVNFSLWEDNSSFQSVSGPFSDRSFGPDSTRPFIVGGNNISSVGTGNLSVGKKDSKNHLGNNSMVSLSISHDYEDPFCLNHDTRKMKVNEVNDSGNFMSLPMELSQNRTDDNSISINTTYGKTNNSILFRPTYTDGGGSIISTGPALNKVEGNFISKNNTLSKEDGSFMLMGRNYSRQDDSILSIGQPFRKGNGNFISIDQRYEKGDGNPIFMGTPYKRHENFISMGLPYNKDAEGLISIDTSYDKHDNGSISVGPAFDKASINIVSMGTTTYDKEDSSILSSGQNYSTGKSNTISFGGFQDEPEVTDPSGNLISSYDLLMPTQVSKEREHKDSEGNSDPIATVASPSSRTDPVTGNKEQKGPKKVPPNNFPSNVKSLLSTGILDGVPVKYVSWSREKNLKGVIKGTGYLCGCGDCNHSKALNAYEFERHAGCKTKHPNNHIYFENGKTIYAVVQELKSTPQEVLFEAIQTATGSLVNQKNFRIWKASYQAATRELQRIYGKDKVIMPS